MSGRMLVATDGHPQSLGALRVARALAEKFGLRGDAVTVLQPAVPAMYDPMFGAAAAYGDVLESLLEAQREKARRQLAEVGGPAAGWPLEALMGSRAVAISRRAAQEGAELIVMGSGRHEWADRWLGHETVLDVLRVAHLPVLAVPEAARELPRRALVATDFSERSLDAGRVAVGLLAPDAEVHVVHVSLAPAVEVAWAAADAWTTAYEAGARTRLAEVARGLEGPGRAVHTHLLRGDPAAELLALAERERADLLATGSHGYGFLSRAILGSVSTRIVRHAHCAVLVVPPRAPSTEPRTEDVEERLHLTAGAAG